MLPIQVLSFPARAIERLVGDSDIAAKAKAAYEKRRAKRTTPRFNAAQQIIDVSGAHAFVPPGADDLVCSLVQDLISSVISRISQILKRRQC